MVKCKIYYINMKPYYSSIQITYVSIKHNNVDMQLNVDQHSVLLMGSIMMFQLLNNRFTFHEFKNDEKNIC